MTRGNLAVLYETEGRYAEAEPLFQQTLATYEKTFGPARLGIVTILENYAQLLRHTHRSDEATQLETRARSIRSALSPGSPAPSNPPNTNPK
ncbi:MAG: hypothetical protein C4293_04780 [Nitrospiraceae bacterium]